MEDAWAVLLVGGKVQIVCGLRGQSPLDAGGQGGRTLKKKDKY